MAEKLTWHIKEVALDDLKEYEHNPRRISKKAIDRLVEDIKNVGYRNRIVIDDNNTIVGGHARKVALLKAGYKKTDKIECLSPSRPLTTQEFKQINVQDNLSYGDFDFDILANHFEVNDLIEWGMDEKLFEGDELDLKEAENKFEDEKESKLIECPECGHKFNQEK